MRALLAAVLLAGLVATILWIEWVQRRAAGWPSDAESLLALRQSGADLSRPVALDFHLHFPSRELAVAAQQALAAEGFEAPAGPSPGPPVSILAVRKSLVPSEKALRAIRKQLVALSRRFGGTYRGWLA